MEIIHIVPDSFTEELTGNQTYHTLFSQQLSKQELEVHQMINALPSKKLLYNSHYSDSYHAPEGLYIHQAGMFKVYEVTLPCSWTDSYDTLSLIESSLPKFILQLPTTRRAAIVQGNNRLSWLDCFDELNNNPDIDTIVLHSNLDTTWGYGGRLAACIYLEQTNRILPDKHYHLHGIGTDPLEILMHAHLHRWIRTVDTSIGFSSGYQGHLLKEIFKHKHLELPQPKGFFKIPTLGVYKKALVGWNIMQLNQWVTGRELEV